MSVSIATLLWTDTVYPNSLADMNSNWANLNSWKIDNIDTLSEALSFASSDFLVINISGTHYKIQASLLVWSGWGGWLRVYQTIAEVKAQTVSSDILFCRDTTTFYSYDASSSRTANDKHVTITWDGGNTRWRAVGWQYMDFGINMASDYTPSASWDIVTKGYWDTNYLLSTPTESFCLAISDETTTITTWTAKVTFRMPYAFTLTEVRASLTTASSSWTPTFDINEWWTTILSTKITIDANETTSTTAATPAVISDSALADDAEITVDIDVAWTGAAGAKIYLIWHQ